MNNRAFKFVFVGLHILLLILVAVAFEKFNISVEQVASLSSISALYTNVAIDWLGTMRKIAYSVIIIMDFVVGCLLIKYGCNRTHEITRFFAIALGAQLILSAALSATILGVIAAGGLWHFISAAVSIVTAGSIFITFSTMIIFWNDLIALGKKQDLLVKAE